MNSRWVLSVLALAVVGGGVMWWLRYRALERSAQVGASASVGGDAWSSREDDHDAAGEAPLTARLNVADSPELESGDPPAISAGASADAAQKHSVKVEWRDGRVAESADVFVRSLDTQQSGRTLVTDTEGVVAFEALAPTVSVWAASGEFRSLPREVRAGKREVLVLTGIVSAEGSLQPNPDVTDVVMHVTCFALDGARRVKLAQARTTIDEPWRMDDLPLADTKQFLFRFESDKSMPIEVTRRAENPGDVLNVDMEILAGYVRAVRVEDSDGRGIAGAQVVATYVNALSRPVSFEGASDDDGNCMLSGVPPREGALMARKQGYAVSYYERPIHAWLPEEQVWTIRMVRAAPVSGRCIAAGAPVEDFDVRWHPRGADAPEVREFRGAIDGVFKLDELAPGRVALVATADAHGQTSVASIELGPDGASDVLLEFQPLVTVSGMVVDALSDAPIPAAIVQPWSASTNRLFGARGGVSVADATGHFLVERANAGVNRFEISAPHYAPQMVGVFGEASRDTDAGVVRLAPAQALDIELVCGPDVIPTESYTVGTARGGAAGKLPPQGFDTQGRLRYPNVSPGEWNLRVSLSNGHELEYGLKLVPGQAWQVRVDVARLAPWSVEVRNADGSIPERFGVSLQWIDDGRVCFVSYGADASHRGRLPIVVSRDAAAVMRVANSAGEWVFEATVGPQDFARDPYVVTLDTPPVGYRVVDEAGAPLAGVSVARHLPGPMSARRLGYLTGPDGVARLPECPGVTYFHPTLGSGAAFGLTAAEQRAGTYQLELAPVGALTLAVRDGAFFVAGAQLDLGPRGCWITQLRTDASGVAKSLPLNAGVWDVRFEMPGYWPAQAEYDVKRDMKPVTLQVRRLADVEFEVRSASAMSIEGCTVELVSEEFGERASEWLARGRVGASSGSLRIDRAGKLKVTGLPHGKYRWSVACGGEGLTAGTVELAPRALGRVSAVVP